MMKQKNRFSNLLEHLMDVTDIKNYVLAKELQYDVSYISKWVSGQMLPSAKTETAVMQGISRCIVKDGSEEGREALMADYQVTNSEDLEGAIYDNLMAEYNYVKDTQKETGNTVAPQTSYYPKLNMPQYISKMHHPVLRRVKSLEIMALIDLMSIEREYRLQIASMESGLLAEQYDYPDVHYSMIIDLGGTQMDYIYDVVFLVNMLANMTHIDFKLYGSAAAGGRAMFCVKDDFMISGMLMESNVCMSVTTSEDPANCDVLYRYIHSLCSRERLLFRSTSMIEMLQKNDYVRTILSPNHRLLVGHMTEHFLSDELFEEISAQLVKTETENYAITLDELRWFHALTKRSYEEAQVRIVFIGSAFSEFAVTGDLDFFNLKVKLTPKQRLRYMEDLCKSITECDNLLCRLVYGRLTSDFLYLSNQWLFLSDGTSYLRLGSGRSKDSLHVINHADVKSAFHCFYEAVWNQGQDIVVSARGSILQYLNHIIGQIRMIANLDESDTPENGA